MDAYRYTVDMGPELGPRLEKVAAYFEAESLTVFVRELLQLAIEMREAEMAANESADGPGAKLDDDIPF